MGRVWDVLFSQAPPKVVTPLALPADRKAYVKPPQPRWVEDAHGHTIAAIFDPEIPAGGVLGGPVEHLEAPQTPKTVNPPSEDPGASWDALCEATWQPLTPGELKRIADALEKIAKNTKKK